MTQPATTSFGAGGRAPGRSGVLGSGFPSSSSSSHRLNCETPEDSDSSWTSITASEVGSSSSISLSPSREDPHSCIMASKASSSAEVPLSSLSDDSCTSITASHVACSSRASLPTLWDGADMAHASSIQLVSATCPPCREEVASCLEAGSMQQHQQELEIQLGAPTPPPDVPDIHSREMEVPIAHHKGQDTLEGPIPARKLEWELGLPAAVDETLQDVPASAPPSPQRPEECDVMLVPMVQDLPFLEETVKRQLESHSGKMKIQQRYGLPTKVLEYEKSFEDTAQGKNLISHPVCRPYRSPFQHWDRRAESGNSAGQPPGPQEESAEPVDTCQLGAQDRAGSRRLCPKCSKAPHHSPPGSEGSRTCAPSDAAAPGAGREGTAGERRPPKDRAKRQQGQKRAAAAQQSQWVHVCGSSVRIPVFRHGWLLALRAPTRLEPSGEQPDTGALGQRHHLCRAAAAVCSPPCSFAVGAPAPSS
ncbi:uncharacterized protein ACIBXB_020964 [Morphnus guianensis]